MRHRHDLLLGCEGVDELAFGCLAHTACGNLVAVLFLALKPSVVMISVAVAGGALAQVAEVGAVSSAVPVNCHPKWSVHAVAKLKTGRRLHGRG